ncbi:CotS family spore coat protein [Clostridium carnis]
MELFDIKKTIEERYSLKVESIEKVKNAYKIVTKDGGYCVKVIKYQYPHFYFIISAINHLKQKEFKSTPDIMPTKDGNLFIELDKSYAYVTKWIKARNSNYYDIEELMRVSEKLGELHKCSEGFVLKSNMNPRIGWYSWGNVFETRCKEILDFKNRINQKAYNSEFDSIYLNAINEELERGSRAILYLKKSKYIELMDREVLKRGFCHHDYAHHNVLIDENNNINVIDFDYCILDSHIHDLSSLIIRTMKNGHWNCDNGSIILNSYCKSNNIYEEELELMKAFISFPQGFWQIGLQYYWEQQPWGEEFFIKKINKYLMDRNNREEFIESFFK